MNTTYLMNTSKPYQANNIARVDGLSLSKEPSGVICSKHAKNRMKQRGIKFSWMNLVLEYGREVYQKGKRTYSISLNKAGSQKITQLYGNTFDINKLSSLYIIMTEDAVIVTCAYR